MKLKKNALIRKTFIAEVLTDVEAKKLFDTAIKTYECKIKGNAVDEDRTTFLKISTSQADRSNDVVNPKGFDVANFINNPVVSAFHQYNQPAVGRALSIGIGTDYVVSKMEFPPKGINPQADILQGLYQSGFMQAASIGFIPKEAEPNDIGGMNFNSIELVEYALVLVPDNPGALQMMLSKGFNPETYEADYIAKGALPFHETPKAPIDQAWDAGKEVKAATVDDLKEMCAWVDSENADNKSAYKLPHHEAAGEHAVVWKGVEAAGAAIQGARGGVDIPDGDMAAVKAHLGKHYTDFEKTPPWEDKDDDKDDGKSADKVITKSGRAISSANEKVVGAHCKALHQAADNLSSTLLGTPTDDQGQDDNNDEDEGEKSYKFTPLKKEIVISDENTPLTELSVGQLKELLGVTGKGIVKKDVDEVIALGMVLDTLSWFIQCFEMNGVNQSSIDKLSQALGLVLLVVQEQAVLGQKSFRVKDFPLTKESVKFLIKAGRAISGANEDKLNAAADHAQQVLVHIQDVLDSVSDQNDEDGAQDRDDDRDISDDNKGGKPNLVKLLALQSKKTQKVTAKADKEIGLTLRILKQIRHQGSNSDGERS